MSCETKRDIIVKQLTSTMRGIVRWPSQYRGRLRQYYLVLHSCTHRFTIDLCPLYLDFNSAHVPRPSIPDMIEYTFIRPWQHRMAVSTWKMIVSGIHQFNNLLVSRDAVKPFHPWNFPEDVFERTWNLVCIENMLIRKIRYPLSLGTANLAYEGKTERPQAINCQATR